MTWVFLPYCVLETLHFTAVMDTRSADSYYGLNDIGNYASMIVLMGWAVTMTLRLRFINSVEGKYYERKVLTEAYVLSRWRDEFDWWIVRRYMKSDVLGNRFLINRRKSKQTEANQ
jgi:hypothetical protein